MSQPEDEETREQPAYGFPPEPSWTEQSTDTAGAVDDEGVASAAPPAADEDVASADDRPVIGEPLSGSEIQSLSAADIQSLSEAAAAGAAPAQPYQEPLDDSQAVSGTGPIVTGSPSASASTAAPDSPPIPDESWSRGPSALDSQASALDSETLPDAPAAAHAQAAPGAPATYDAPSSAGQSAMPEAPFIPEQPAMPERTLSAQLPSAPESPLTPEPPLIPTSTFVSSQSDKDETTTIVPPAAPANPWQSAPVQPAVPPAQQPWQPAAPSAPQQPWQAPAAPQQWQQPQAPAPPPAQQWPQPQAPSQQWQQAPGQQWQQPPYAPPPPGYVQGQQGWSAEPPYGSSAFASVAGLILVLFGLAVAAIGAWAFTQGPEIGRFIRDNDVALFGSQISRDTLRAVLSPMPAILVVLGILQLISGAGVFAHKGWARALGLLLALIGLLVALFAVSMALALAPGASIPVIISIVLLIGYAFVVLALMAGGKHFRRLYPPAR